MGLLPKAELSCDSYCECGMYYPDIALVEGLLLPPFGPGDTPTVQDVLKMSAVSDSVGA